MNLCDYGCNQEAKYVLKNGKNCCEVDFRKCKFQREKRSKTLKGKTQKRNYIICEYCGKQISKSNYERHIKICKSKEIINYELKNTGDKYICNFCGKVFSKYGIKNHIKFTHLNYKKYSESHEAWNKGLTKETDERIKKLAKTLSKNSKGRNKGISLEKRLGKEKAKEVKKKISERMKQAHAKGKAWNIGKSRWNNEPSYPEKFFMKVIGNEFNDKNYIKEYAVSKYAIDFAWVEKKKAIEIDGQQHEKLEYKKRDNEKDKLLTSLGWKVLRIKWKDMFHNPKKYINLAYNFIH